MSWSLPGLEPEPTDDENLNININILKCVEMLTFGGFDEEPDLHGFESVDEAKRWTAALIKIWTQANVSRFTNADDHDAIVLFCWCAHEETTLEDIIEYFERSGRTWVFQEGRHRGD